MIDPEHGSLLVMENIERARNAAGAKHTFVTWWRRTQIETAWTSLRAAEEDLILILDDETLAPRLPALRATLVAAHDTTLDPYVKAIEEMEAGTKSLDRLLLRTALRAAHSAGDQRHADEREFRNLLVVVTLGLLAL